MNCMTHILQHIPVRAPRKIRTRNSCPSVIRNPILFLRYLFAIIFVSSFLFLRKQVELLLEFLLTRLQTLEPIRQEPGQTRLPWFVGAAVHGGGDGGADGCAYGCSVERGLCTCIVWFISFSWFKYFDFYIQRVHATCQLRPSGAIALWRVCTCNCVRVLSQ